MPDVRVLIADDHPVFREGLARIARAAAFDVVAEVADGSTALALMRRLQPELAIVDLRLPELDGIGVAAAARREQLQTRVLIVSAYDDEALVYRAIEAGAAGYLTKDAGRAEITDAAVRIVRGETVVAPALIGGLASQLRGRRGDGAALTPRERQVLALVCAGMTAPEIGRELHVGVSTVKTHLGHLYEKLGVRDRAAAAAEAMRRGLVE